MNREEAFNCKYEHKKIVRYGGGYIHRRSIKSDNPGPKPDAGDVHTKALYNKTRAFMEEQIHAGKTNADIYKIIDDLDTWGLSQRSQITTMINSIRYATGIGLPKKIEEKRTAMLADVANKCLW